MNDLDALMKAIIADPTDDTVRLVYADRLEELEPARVSCPKCGGSSILPNPIGRNRIRRNCDRCTNGTILDTSSAARAEFIRLQIQLSRMPIRRILPDRCLKKRGPDYWETTIDYEFNVGERVDVHIPGREVGAKPRIRHGLLVTKILGERVALKQDGESKPSPRPTLEKREKELLAKHGRAWRDLDGYSIVVDFHRGFGHRLRINALPFLDHSSKILHKHPLLSEVELLDRRPLQGWDLYGSLTGNRLNAFWARGDGLEDPELLPDAIWDLLDGFEEVDVFYKKFHCKTDANESLSRAAIKWGHQ